MRTRGQLKVVETQLIKDLMESSITLQDLGEKYGVTRQAVSLFALKHGIKRPQREHTEKCSICQRLRMIAKKPQSEFISWQTIRKQLELETVEISYHICILRKKGLVSRKFGRMRSKSVELAFQIHFKKKIPITTIGRQVGIKNFFSIMKKYKDAGWNVSNSVKKKG